MVFQGAGQRETHIANFVGDERKHIVLEMLIKDLFSGVHDLFTHDNEKLSALKTGFGTRAEVVLDDLNDSLLLLDIVSKFD